MRVPTRNTFIKSAIAAMACCTILLADSGIALRADAQNRGLEIAKEADRRDSGWQDYQTSMTMVLRNRFGQESSRAMKVKGMEMPADGDRTLTVFQSPGDVKGTAFLSFTHRTGPDDQWLYLPSVKRVKRIASKNKSGPFMGSEFAYEDISTQEIEKYSYRFLGESAVNETPCYSIERIPVSSESGYSKQIAHFDREHYRPQKVEYFDRKGAPLKTLSYAGYRQYRGKFWRAQRMSMVNHQTGKSTELLWGEYRFRVGLTPRQFDRNSLRRAH